MYQSTSGITVLSTGLNGLQDGGRAVSGTEFSPTIGGFRPQYADLYLQLIGMRDRPPPGAALDVYVVPYDKANLVVTDFYLYDSPPRSMYAGTFVPRTDQTNQTLLLPKVRLRPLPMLLGVVSRLGMVLPSGCSIVLVPFGEVP